MHKVLAAAGSEIILAIFLQLRLFYCRLHISKKSEEKEKLPGKLIVVQIPTQSRVSYEIKPECSRL